MLNKAESLHLLPESRLLHISLRINGHEKIIILFIFIILTVHFEHERAKAPARNRRSSYCTPSTSRKAGQKQTYLDIERKFGEEGFTVKAIPLQIPGIRTMEGFQEKRTMILERVPRATHLSRMHRRSLLACRPPVV